MLIAIDSPKPYRVRRRRCLEYEGRIAIENVMARSAEPVWPVAWGEPSQLRGIWVRLRIIESERASF